MLVVLSHPHSAGTDVQVGGQEALNFQPDHKEIEDCFFDMTWLEGEDDWLSLKQEAQTSLTISRTDTRLQQPGALDKVNMPTQAPKVFNKGCVCILNWFSDWRIFRHTKRPVFKSAYSFHL